MSRLSDDLKDGLNEMIAHKKGKITLRSEVIEIPEPPIVRKPSHIKKTGITAFSPTEKLKDINLIGAAIMECLVENDPEGAMEAIKTHLEAMNKTAFLREAGIPRSTMYKSLKTKNPTLKTLAKIIYVAHHSQD